MSEADRDLSLPYRELFESNPQPMWVYDVGSLRIVAANDAAARRYGYSRAEFLGLTIADLRPPDDLPALRAAVSRAPEGIGESGIWRHRRKNGEILYAEVTSHGLTVDGRPARLVMAVDVTERLEAERRLRRAQERLQAIFDSGPECVKIVSGDGILLDMNPAGLRMIGADRREQAVGKEIGRLVHPEDRGSYLRLHRDALAGRSGRLVFRIIGLGGAERWMESHATPLKGSDGAIEAVLSVTRDVTEQRRESDLRALETRVLDMLSAGATLTAVLVEIAETVDRMIPEVRSSILLVEDGRLRHGAAPRLPADYNRMIEGLAIGEKVGSCGTAAFRGRQVIVADIRTDPLWDDYRDIAEAFGLRACWSTPVLDAQSRVLATFALYYEEPRAPGLPEQQLIDRIGHFVRTAIERHRAIEALRESEERFRTIAGNIQEVFWITDPSKTRMLHVSPAYETIWGRSCAELYANPRQWLEAIHPADRDRVLASAMRQYEGVYVEEYRIRRPDGSVRWVSDRSFAVRDETGVVRRIVGTASDITPRKNAELALRKRLKELGCLYKSLSLIADSSRSVEEVCRGIVDILPPSLLHEDLAVARIAMADAEIRSSNWREPAVSLAVPIRARCERIDSLGVPKGREF